MNAGNKKIHLKSTENEIVETTMKCALMSNTIKDMLEAIGDDSDEKCLEVPIDTVSTATLKKCVEWMTKWQDQPQPTSEEIKDKLAERIDLWDEDFLKMDLIDLYNLVSDHKFENMKQKLRQKSFSRSQLRTFSTFPACFG